MLAQSAPNSIISQAVFPPPTKFKPQRDMPDLYGKIALVTGGAGGIGFETSKALLLKNAKVYIAARSMSQATEAANKLKELIGKEPQILILDLSDFASIKKAAEEFLAKEETLEILFNNAGVMGPPLDQFTTQGYDLRTNTLGHYYFTMLLLPALQRSTSTHGKKARIVNTSSIGFNLAPDNGFEWATLKRGPERDAKVKEWENIKEKIQGNIVLSNILQRYHGDQIISFSLNPGGIKSGLNRHGSSTEKTLSKILLHPTSMGAVTQLWAGTMPQAEDVAGAYLIPWARIGDSGPLAKNEKLQDEFKAYVEEQISAFESTSGA
ncbi:hypothetical protein M422DRAFT_232460 [Sphaerobolus stellatus SS14]|uniref:Protochlorophyllide reductase n=1 Tax=Sphaerobolus stellatus (strain SS14) TaxID=990650 RepID=A0A0C9U1I3_SPHS4|nr:hypothetical protein M422DRAFT_232460 [Sphaerobolus stellatus SS14]